MTFYVSNNNGYNTLHTLVEASISSNLSIHQTRKIMPKSDYNGHSVARITFKVEYVFPD